MASSAVLFHSRMRVPSGCAKQRRQIHVHFRQRLLEKSSVYFSKNNNKEETGRKGGSSAAVIRRMSGPTSKSFGPLTLTCTDYNLSHLLWMKMSGI